MERIEVEDNQVKVFHKTRGWSGLQITCFYLYSDITLKLHTFSLFNFLIKPPPICFFNKAESSENI